MLILIHLMEGDFADPLNRMINSFLDLFVGTHSSAKLFSKLLSKNKLKMKVRGVAFCTWGFVETTDSLVLIYLIATIENSFEFIFRSDQIRPRYSWLSGANATSVLCRPFLSECIILQKWSAFSLHCLADFLRKIIWTIHSENANYQMRSH